MILKTHVFRSQTVCVCFYKQTRPPPLPVLAMDPRTAIGEMKEGSLNTIVTSGHECALDL